MSIEGLAQRLVEVRLANGYNRKQLSEKLNIPYRTITNYENGQNEPGHSYLIKISQLFDVSVDYLLGIKEKAPAPDESETDALLKTITDCYHGMNINGRRKLAEYAVDLKSTDRYNEDSNIPAVKNA